MPILRFYPVAAKNSLFKLEELYITSDHHKRRSYTRSHCSKSYAVKH